MYNEQNAQFTAIVRNALANPSEFLSYVNGVIEGGYPPAEILSSMYEAIEELIPLKPDDFTEQEWLGTLLAYQAAYVGTLSDTPDETHLVAAVFASVVEGASSYVVDMDEASVAGFSAFFLRNEGGVAAAVARRGVDLSDASIEDRLRAITSVTFFTLMSSIKSDGISEALPMTYMGIVGMAVYHQCK